jgi:hypothetical protein
VVAIRYCWGAPEGAVARGLTVFRCLSGLTAATSAMGHVWTSGNRGRVIIIPVTAIRA